METKDYEQKHEMEKVSGGAVTETKEGNAIIVPPGVVSSESCKDCHSCHHAEQHHSHDHNHPHDPAHDPNREQTNHSNHL